MISRRAAKAIADAYHAMFTYSYHGSRTSRFQFYRERAYDFLFVAEVRPWVMNAVKRIRLTSKRGLLEFVMRLHTGESAVDATEGWPWDRRRLLGQRVLLELGEALIRERVLNPDFETHTKSKRAAVDAMRRSLELEGYVFSDGRLRLPEESPIDEPEEEGVLQQLAGELELPTTEVLRHHLELAASHFVDGRWDDSIANSRKVLEWTLGAAAKAHSDARPGGPRFDATRPASVRGYLEDVGLLEKIEKEAVAKTYGLLSQTGGHPYVAAQDQARLTRHLSLTFSQFVLLRLRGALSGGSS